MQIIHGHLHHWREDATKVAVEVDRLTLAKRRWRGVAEDGADFGFDLEHALEDGDVFFENGRVIYRIVQKAEPVLEVELGTDAAKAARLGWIIGNLHFQLEVTEGLVRVADDPALRQLFEREHIHFHAQEAVFHPLSGGHHHH